MPLQHGESQCDVYRTGYGMPQQERLIKFDQIAIHQMSVLESDDNDIKLLKSPFKISYITQIYPRRFPKCIFDQ